MNYVLIWNLHVAQITVNGGRVGKLPRRAGLVDSTRARGVVANRVDPSSSIEGEEISATAQVFAAPGVIEPAARTSGFPVCVRPRVRTRDLANPLFLVSPSSCYMLATRSLWTAASPQPSDRTRSPAVSGDREDVQSSQPSSVETVRRIPFEVVADWYSNMP